MSLRQTLQSLQKQADDERDSRERIPAMKAEWIASIDRFYAIISDYLKEFIDDGSILLSSGAIVMSEELFDQYSASTLNLHVGDVTLKFQPIGRFIIGGTGRIDMFRAGSGSETNRSNFERSERY